MARDDPYRMMTLIFGVLLVVALVVLYLVMTGGKQAPSSGGSINAPNHTANASNRSVLSGNPQLPSNVIVLANTSQNRSLVHMQKEASVNGSNSTAMQITVSPGRCAAPSYLPGGNLSIAQAKSFMSGYYSVTAESTQQTFVQMSASVSMPPLTLTSQNFTSVTSLKIPVGSAFFFCNPSSQYDTVTYAITRYG